MDITSYYYFTELAKDLNMSRTAERIFVSQQTISNHIQRMEEHYGTRLFYRKPSLSLTYAGEYVLEFAQRLLREHRNLEDFLGDVEKQEKGALRFGAGTLRLNDALPVILPAFSGRYPDVSLEITSAGSAKLEPMVIEGKLDLAIVLDEGRTDPSLEADFLGDDQVYFCISEKMLQEESREWKEKALRGIEAADCLRFPLCMTENRMGAVIRSAFREVQKEPKVFLSTTEANLSFMVCCTTGAAGTFIQNSRLAGSRESIPDDMNIFPVVIHGKPVIQKINLIRRKDRYLSAYVRFFAELLKTHFGSIEQIRMERAVAL